MRGNVSFDLIFIETGFVVFVSTFTVSCPNEARTAADKIRLNSFFMAYALRIKVTLFRNMLEAIKSFKR